jgi:hypothetical protein
MRGLRDMPADGGGRSRLDWLWRHQDLVIELGLLLAVELLLLAALAPSAALRDVLPYGSDHTGHPYNVSELANNLRHFRLTGWSQGWFAGFPTGVLYPVLAPGIAAIGSLIIPLAVAYKLTVLAGPLLLPPCAYLAGRLARLPRAYPVLLAVFTVPFLFDVSCNICGGSIDATMLGEYAYSWGIAFGLLALGATVRLCEGTGSRWWPPLLLGAAALAHPVTAIWTALGVALILGHSWLFNRRPPTRAIIPMVAALLLAASWWLPFLADRQFMPEPLQVKYTGYLGLLFPSNPVWGVVLTVLAASGVFLAYRNRQPFLAAIASLTVVMALAFRFLPESQVPNWRVVELWSLGRWTLAAVGCLEGVRWLVPRVRLALVRRWPDGAVRYAVPAVALLVVALAQGVPWGLWPGEQLVHSRGTHERWLELDFPAVAQAQFPGHVFGGVAANPDAAQYEAMISMLESVARRHGCGRVALDENWYGGVFRYYDELDSLPLITNGCLTTILGTLADSGDNVPAAFVAESASSVYPLLYVPNLPYLSFNLQVGIPDLRQLGVTYYLTHGGTAEAAAGKQPDLTLVGSTPSVQLWEISDAAVVAPLSNQPVVVTGLSGKLNWQRYYLYYELTSEWGQVLQTQSGPAAWPRAVAGQRPDSVAQPPVTVSDVSVTDSAISFTVSRVGIPVEVRESYFPGWQVHGGSGPYRAMPDFMVVVPTSRHVTLVYTTTAVITTAHVLGALGLLGVVALGLLDRRRRRTAPPAGASPPPRKGAAPPKGSGPGTARVQPRGTRAGPPSRGRRS